MFFESDYNKGKKFEDEYFDFFKTYFNEPGLIQNDRFNTFDFSSDNILIELKQRNFESFKFDDTMIGLNKIKKCESISNKLIYFIILFSDGLYSYQYNKNDNFNYRVAGRLDRGINELKNYCFIPIKYFKKIN